MRKIVLGVLLVVTSTTYAQKDELKTLKKLYDKEQLSADDFSKYKETVLKLESVATTENDKIAAGFYKAMQPLAELSTMGGKPNPMMIQKLFTPEIFTIMVEGMRKTLDFESKQEKKVFTDDIKNTIDIFKPIFKQMAFAFNGSKKYKEASRVFYNTFQLDPTDVANLENSILADPRAGNNSWTQRTRAEGLKNINEKFKNKTDLGTYAGESYIAELENSPYNKALRDYEKKVNQLSSTNKQQLLQQYDPTRLSRIQALQQLAGTNQFNSLLTGGIQ